MHDSTNLSIELLDADREPLTGPIGDVQSHAFSTAIGINPLIAAAMPLLSCACEIEYLTQIDPLVLAHNLQHEIKAFENAAHKNGYPAQIILAARYLLCTVLDEFIERFHPHLNWSAQSLLNHFQSEKWGGNRFFVILERSIEDPATYIDLLELGYIHLSLGYRGKYSNPDQHRALGLFIDQLYQLIERQRGDQQPTITHTAYTHIKSAWRLPPWWVMALSCSLLLGSIFLPYTLKLNKAMTPLVYNINHYEQNYE